MNFRTTFDIEKTKVDRIPMFFKARGYKLEFSSPGNYRFTRGSSWTATVTRNIKSFPTQVEVILTEKAASSLEVLVLYDIDTLGRAISSDSQGEIKAELTGLQDFCQRIV
jgi:hypothetical protein